ncbi:MAG: 6-carboxytetrahydropterin synthase [Nitrososphaeria archaeon]|nr:6-carboxytetrahydropterin synthase [Nitrososphaeria archaeon]NIQ33413.1 6-carboxytetrahydropterin synthase [Nitrososphaeria archaeon]
MYTIATRKNLIAQHYLPKEEGPESKKHSHLYRIEISLSGNFLDENGYLVNLIEIQSVFEELIDHFRDKTLNDLEKFHKINPSIENFARIFCESFIRRLMTPNVKSMSVKIWETEDTWASYQTEV